MYMQKKTYLVLAGLMAGLMFSPMPSYAAAKDQPVTGKLIEQENPQNYEGFVWRIDSEGTALPRNFRTSEDAFKVPNKKFKLDESYQPSRAGLDTLRTSGAAQCSPAEMKALYEALRAKTQGPIYDVDLRQESHGYLDGTAVSWFGQHDWANVQKSQRAALRDEAKRLHAAVGRTVYMAPLGKDKLPKSGKVLRVTKAQTEREVAESIGFRYFRIAATDHAWPSEANIDRFIAFYRQLPAGAWLHFHCEAGVGRTTAYMDMYDMMRNPQVSFKDITYRQHMLGGFYYGPFKAKVKEADSWKKAYYEEKAAMMQKFYDYVQANYQTNFQTTWSKWLHQQQKT